MDLPIPLQQACLLCFFILCKEEVIIVNCKDKEVIKNYEDQENMMILIYAQWCINNDLDPFELYEQAYPNQKRNDALMDAMDLTVSKEESDLIDDQTLFQVLDLFGNTNLAFTVQEAIEKRENQSS